MTSPLIALSGISVWLEDGTEILRDISWTVRADEHWAVLGPNGAGKTTLFNVATARRYPSRGTVEVLGRRFGEASMLELRQQMAIVDPHQTMYEWFTVQEVVLTGTTGTVQPQPEQDTPEHRAHLAEVAEALGITWMLEREIRSLSQGERQRVRLARALMAQPRLIVLDEPALGLDFPAREALISALNETVRARPGIASIMISHHLEELPDVVTHALLLRDGAVVASGPVAEVLTAEPLSTAFGLPVEVSRERGRWRAWAAPGW